MTALDNLISQVSGESGHTECIRLLCLIFKQIGSAFSDWLVENLVGETKATVTKYHTERRLSGASLAMKPYANHGIL